MRQSWIQRRLRDHEWARTTVALYLMEAITAMVDRRYRQGAELIVGAVRIKCSRRYVLGELLRAACKREELQGSGETIQIKLGGWPQ